MLASLLLASSVALCTVHASKGYFALADRIDCSALACIGRVEEVIEVPVPPGVGRRSSLPFARVAIERVIKGDPGAREVLHEAWPSWTCDTTGARVGQRALFLHTRSSSPASLPSGWSSRRAAARPRC